MPDCVLRVIGISKKSSIPSFKFPLLVHVTPEGMYPSVTRYALLIDVEVCPTSFTGSRLAAK